MSTANEYFICSLEELDSPGSKAFSLEQHGHNIDGFVVRYKGGVSVYLNQCPHTGASLNWQPDQFLSYDERYIQCSIHGAIFEFHDGLCIHGPCAGQKLKKLKYRLDSDRIFVELDPEQKNFL
ncbi:MAG: Rieske (2Fe-2S) protein [Gammaproteobacteria bacterium]|jgi:nitrite reductase/ring-hydroxylating ferredoxin subunit